MSQDLSINNQAIAAKHLVPAKEETKADSPEEMAVKTANKAEEKNDTSKKLEEGAAKKEKISREQLEVMAKNLEDFFSKLNKDLEFSVDQESGHDVFKVFEKSTGNLIRQYPSEEVLGLMSKLADSAGLLLSTEA